MALTKLIYQDANEALVNAAYQNGQQMSSLIEFDTGIKSAASNLVSKELLEEYRPKDSHTACIHLIAMGDAETYGFNRNGDAFPQKALEKYASTFVSNGNLFREHRNKDKKKRLGSVKWAGYDPSPKGMHRVELIVHMNKDAAEEEFEMAKQGSALNFSMSCRVPNDRCSCCGNKAKRTSDYCDCLKYNMGQWQEKSASYAFAYNDDPTFFDISIVKHPADRIARHLEYSFAKEASDNSVISGAKLAEMEGVNYSSMEIEELSMLNKLASAEKYISELQQATDERGYACQSAYPFSMMEKFSQEELDQATQASAGTLFNAMAKKSCIMSFPAFCQYIENDVNACDSALCKKAAILLPDVFSDMLDGFGIMRPITDQFRASSNFMSDMDQGNDGIQKLMDKVEDKFSMQSEPVRRRVIRITITCGVPDSELSERLQKNASSDADQWECRKLANAYAQYQIRALCDIQDKLGESAVNDNLIDTVAAANSALVFDRN